jgi:precorrin-2 dehydrogenase/sirohydrochlorin ferrochelatase
LLATPADFRFAKKALSCIIPQMKSAAFSLYPISLSLKGRHCLLVGLGAVGQRKLSGLVPCAPASILVLDSAPPSQQALPLLTAACVQFEQRACVAEDVFGKIMVFVATDDTRENTRIADMCHDANVLCNCATEPERGSFYVPAVVRQGCLEATISTGGASPALVRRWRPELADWLAPRARMAVFMGRLRPLILALHNASEQNTKLFRELTESPLQQWLHEGDIQRCRLLLEEKLPQNLHAHLAELLDDLS